MRSQKQKRNIQKAGSELVTEELERLSRIMEEGPRGKCSLCNEVWFYRKTTVVSGDPFVCPDCHQKESEKHESLERLKRMVGKFSVERFTLDKFKVHSKEQESAFFAARNFDPAKDGLFLNGPCGVGKTHLAVALIQKFYFDLEESVGFIRPHSLVRMLRGRFGSEEEEILQGFARKKLLVVDDIGLGKGTQYMLDLLYDIFDFRISNGIRGIIITSNIDLDAIRDKFGDKRLSSRISDLCDGILMGGPDGRLERPTEEESESQEEIPF